MNRLVLGYGLLGKEIVRQTGWEYVDRSRGFDITRNSAEWVHLFHGYDEIVNCVAHTDTYGKDKQPHWDTNYIGTQRLVGVCNYVGAKLIHVSSDYVFSNSFERTESSVPVHACNWYSYTKLLADAHVESSCMKYLILRATHKPTPFPYDKAWVDQVGNFDYVDVIADLMIKAIVQGLTGTYNLGTETKTMYDLALKTNESVVPASNGGDYPKNVSMDTSKFYRDIVS